jgi:hypothetical protein
VCYRLPMVERKEKDENGKEHGKCWNEDKREKTTT